MHVKLPAPILSTLSVTVLQLWKRDGTLHDVEQCLVSTTGTFLEELEGDEVVVDFLTSCSHSLNIKAN